MDYSVHFGFEVPISALHEAIDQDTEAKTKAPISLGSFLITRSNAIINSPDKFHRHCQSLQDKAGKMQSSEMATSICEHLGISLVRNFGELQNLIEDWKNID